MKREETFNKNIIETIKNYYDVKKDQEFDLFDLFDKIGDLYDYSYNDLYIKFQDRNSITFESDNLLINNSYFRIAYFIKIYLIIAESCLKNSEYLNFFFEVKYNSEITHIESHQFNSMKINDYFDYIIYIEKVINNLNTSNILKIKIIVKIKVLIV